MEKYLNDTGNVGLGKAVLISIKPQYCELISSGRKSLEIRKSKPKLTPPFKCYIYATKDVAHGDISGKVIGEFICDGIDEYRAEATELGGSIQKRSSDDECGGGSAFEPITSSGIDNSSNCKLCRRACLLFDDIVQYVVGGKDGFYKFYAWHITKLRIYNTPRELSEFKDALCRAPQSWCYITDFDID